MQLWPEFTPNRSRWVYEGSGMEPTKKSQKLLLGPLEGIGPLIGLLIPDRSLWIV